MEVKIPVKKVELKQDEGNINIIITPVRRSHQEMDAIKKKIEKISAMKNAVIQTAISAFELENR